MKVLINSIVFLATSLIMLPALAENHLNVHNHTGQKIRAECGHDGQSGRTYSIEPDHSATMRVHTHHGEPHVNCRAINLHGQTVASREFHFDGSHSYNWSVKGHHH